MRKPRPAGNNPNPTEAETARRLQAEMGAIPDRSYDTPEVDEVLQADYDPAADDPVVKVRAVEPTATTEMPSKLGGMFTVVLPTDASPRRLIGEDARRKAVTVLPVNGDVYLAGSQGEADAARAGAGGPAFLLGANTPLTLGVSSELFVAVPAGGPQVTVSVAVEQWAR